VNLERHERESDDDDDDKERKSTGSRDGRTSHLGCVSRSPYLILVYFTNYSSVAIELLASRLLSPCVTPNRNDRVSCKILSFLSLSSYHLVKSSISLTFLLKSLRKPFSYFLYLSLSLCILSPRKDTTTPRQYNSQ